MVLREADIHMMPVEVLGSFARHFYQDVHWPPIDCVGLAVQVSPKDFN